MPCESAAGGGGRARATKRRTWEDHVALRFPRAYRTMAALAWRTCERLRPAHPLRHAVYGRVINRSYGAFNRNDLDVLRALYDTECCWDWSHFEGWLTDPVTRGFEGLRHDWLTFRAAWGACTFEPSQLRDLGDRWMITCHMHGTGSGSGVGVERTWWQIARARDGLIVSIANYSDRQEALDAAAAGQ